LQVIVAEYHRDLKEVQSDPRLCAVPFARVAGSTCSGGSRRKTGLSAPSPACDGLPDGRSGARGAVLVETMNQRIAMHHDTDLLLRRILTDVLGLKQGQADSFTHQTGLFGHLPELDSMAVAGLLTEMEDRLDIFIEDDEVDGEMLESYGSLLAFAVNKRDGK
jgi:acyl carrier protein